MVKPTQELVKERSTTHGDYVPQARLSQKLKRALEGEDSWYTLDPVYRDALQLITTKISRMLSGNPHTKDHWEDVAGYSLLVAKYIEEERDGKPRGQGQTSEAKKEFYRPFPGETDL